MTPADARPLVSVAITTFNHAQFLNETLAGIRAQDYRPLEVVAYDNASTDSSKALLEAFRESVDFPVTVLGGSNLGPMRSLKRAIIASSGKYVAILEGDDVWLPGKLAAQVQWLEEDPKRALCAHDVECFDSDTGERLWTARQRGLLRTGAGAARSVRDGPLFPSSAIMLRREVVPTNFNPLELRDYHDWNLWSDCLADGGVYGFVPGMYSRYRRHPQSYVIRAGGSIEASTKILESGLLWLGEFEAHHPEHHAACRFRRATLLANHGRLLFERGHVREARTYIRAAIPGYGCAFWKGLGLMIIASLPRGVAGRVYSLAGRGRTASRRLATLRRRSSRAAM